MKNGDSFFGLVQKVIQLWEDFEVLGDPGVQVAASEEEAAAQIRALWSAAAHMYAAADALGHAGFDIWVEREQASLRMKAEGLLDTARFRGR